MQAPRQIILADHQITSHGKVTAQDLALQALEMFQGHVEEVAGAAGGVQHPHIGKPHLEGGDQLDGLRVLALLVQGEGRAVHRGPLLAQGLDDGGQDQPFHIGPRGVVGAELVALLGVQGAFEQGAEDGGLHMAPVGLSGVDEQVDLGAVQGQGLTVREQAAVEAQHGAAQDGGEGAALVHVAPQVFGERDELGGVLPHGAQQVAEAGRFQQAHVLGEQGEEAADEEGGGQLRGWPACSRETARRARRVAMSRVTRAARRLGSSDRGSSQTARSRARICGSRRSPRRMRWERGSG